MRTMLVLALAGCADNLVHGRATVDGDARPVDHATIVVEAADGRHVAYTDDDGRYELALPVGFWRSELHVAGGIYAPFQIGPLVPASSHASVECTSCSPLLHPKCPSDSHVTALARDDTRTLIELELRRIDLFRRQAPAGFAVPPPAGPIWLVDERAGALERASAPHYWPTTLAKLQREADRARHVIAYAYVRSVEASDGCAHVVAGVDVVAPHDSVQFGEVCCCSVKALWTKRDGDWMYVGDEVAACG